MHAPVEQTVKRDNSIAWTWQKDTLENYWNDACSSNFGTCFGIFFTLHDEHNIHTLSVRMNYSQACPNGHLY